MAVTRVRKLFTNRSGAQDWGARIQYTCVFEVVTDNPLDGETTIYNGVDPNDGTQKVAHFGDRHPDSPYAIVVNVDIQQSEDSNCIWYVTVKYDSNPERGSSSTQQTIQPTTTGSLGSQGEIGNRVGEVNPNPLLRPAKWKLTSMDKEVPVDSWVLLNANGKPDPYIPLGWSSDTGYPRGAYVSASGNIYYCVHEGATGSTPPTGTGDSVYHEINDGTAVWAYWSTIAQATNDLRYYIPRHVANSGGLPFDPSVTETDSTPVLSVTMAIPGIDLPYFASLKNAQNSLPWKGLPPRWAKILRIEANSNVENNFPYVECTWEIGMDPDTWDIRVLDCGYGSLATRSVPNPSAPPLKIMKTTYEQHKDATGAPVGHPVPMDGKGGVLPPGADPVFLRGWSRRRKMVDFNSALPF